MKKLIKFNRITLLLVVMAAPLLMWSSCKVDKISKNKTGTEAPKYLTGTWKVVKATRNGTDLFALGDTALTNEINKFSVSFTNTDYKLINRIPFITATDGTYSLDNPDYPFQLTFKPTSGTSTSIPFTYPIVDGARQLTLVFNIDCSQNTYQYTLQKSN